MKMRISQSQQTSQEFVEDNLLEVSLKNLNFNKISSDEPNVSIGTQARLLSLNRLRFWPKSVTWELILFSQFGILLFLIAWTILAAQLIYYFEQKIENCDRLVNNASKKLFNSLRCTDFGQWLQIIEDSFSSFENTLISNFLNGLNSSGEIWSRAGCFLFVVMVSTSLAFGCPVPSSKSGQVVTLIYAIIGIPVNFLFAMNFGKLLAKILYNYVTKNRNRYDEELPLILDIFPIVSALIFYTIGILIFGILRQRDILSSLIFPLDFTVMGGLAMISSLYRILYAFYLELSVILISVIIALLQLSNSNSRIKNSFNNKDLLTEY